MYRLPDAWEEVAAGASWSDIAPTLEAPTAVIAALATGIGDVLPPDRAMDRHLRDAVGVRDRLLAIVEHTAGVKA